MDPRDPLPFAHRAICKVYIWPASWPYTYQRRQSKYIFFGGGAIEAPRRWGVGRGCPPPTGGGVWRGGTAPSPEFFFDFGSQNGDLWCILGAIFCSSAKILRGRKDTLAQIYFYWGGGEMAPPPPPRVDATGTYIIFFITFKRGRFGG